MKPQQIPHAAAVVEAVRSGADYSVLEKLLSRFDAAATEDPAAVVEVCAEAAVAVILPANATNLDVARACLAAVLGIDINNNTKPTNTENNNA